MSNMNAASAKRTRLVVAGPKLSLANLYAGKLPPKNTTMVSSVARTASDAGCDGLPTTVVVDSLIATCSPYALRGSRIRSAQQWCQCRRGHIIASITGADLFDAIERVRA